MGSSGTRLFPPQPAASHPASRLSGMATPFLNSLAQLKTRDYIGPTQNQNYKGYGLSKGKEREGEWDFYWCDVSWLRENFDHTYMDEHVRISHFRNHYELTRKNYMVKNLKRFRKQLEREAGKLEAAKCDFFPKTFEMPCEYHLFVEEFRKNPGITWIMKPAPGNFL